MKTPELYLLGKNDAPELAAFERACFPSAWTAEQYALVLRERIALGSHGPAYPASVCEAFLQRDLAVIGLYTAEAGLAAYISMRILDREAEIYNIAVREDLRGRGLGTGLLEAALSLAERSGIISVFLEVRESNVPARALYSRTGFMKTGQRTGYYPDGESAVLMAWSLDKQPQ